MKIAYVAIGDASRATGVLKKITGQIKCWMNEGLDVQLFLISRSRKKNPLLNDIPVTIIDYQNTFRRMLYINFQDVYSWNPDLVYLRQCIYYPSIYKLLTKIPSIIEINSDDNSEYKITLSKPKYLFHRIMREKVLKKAKGFVFVTNELSDGYLRYEEPFTVIGNGIDLSQYRIKEPAENKYPKVVFIGSPGQSWHGVDKIKVMAQEFREWEFHVIGYEQIGPELNNLHCHGYLTKNDYESIVLKSDIAIGTLALHRKKMKEACPLKVREYLAYGLPTIIGYRDTDFMNKSSFLLEISNSENNVKEAMAKIRKFADEWMEKRISYHEISHLDLTVKEKKRVSFFNSVYNKI